VSRNDPPVAALIASPEAELSSMLVQMDSHLRVLEEELGALADGPVARRSVEPEPPRSPEPAVSRWSPERHLAAAPSPLRAAEPRPVADARPAPVSPEARFDKAIIEARLEAERVVADAHRRIAEIGARARAVLEERDPDVTRTSRARSPVRVEEPERREYRGVVAIEAGPFDDVVTLSEFEVALFAIPAVDDVYIRTFERRHAHFELQISEPTRLIAELQAGAPEALYVLEAGEDHVRVEIFKDE